MSRAKSAPRFSYRRVTALLQRSGWDVGTSRVQRIRRMEGLQVKKQRRTRRKGPADALRQQAEHPNHVWSWDFVHDQTEHRSTFRILSLIDDHPRECHVRAPAWSIKAADAIEHLRSDNEPEFIAYAMQDWLSDNNVKTAYINPGSPSEQGHVGSFHDNLRRSPRTDRRMAKSI